MLSASKHALKLEVFVLAHPQQSNGLSRTNVGKTNLSFRVDARNLKQCVTPSPVPNDYEEAGEKSWVVRYYLNTKHCPLNIISLRFLPTVEMAGEWSE